MSYLGSSGSAAGDRQTVLPGGGGGAGGALSFPFSSQGGLVLLVGAGPEPLEEGVACRETQERWGGKGA